MIFKVHRLKIKVFLFFLLFTVYYSLFTVSYAAHPLITDDTGTQGKGKFQLEVNGEYGHDKDDGITTNTGQMATTLSYGVIEPLDVVFGIPYQHIRVKDSETATTEEGISDMSIELKWRFYERDGLSFAIKPGFTLPTGDDKKGLGSGRITYSLFFITTKEIKPWAFHLNLGYIRNDNNADERKNLWHTSLAATVEVIKNLNLVGNIGIEKNTDKNVNIHPAFVIGGLIYSLSENFDIDFGVKGGLNKPETDYSVLAGITLRF
ncbi:MAG: transporter [Nitrospirae bacterium]|nr:transporter [Nitrospirota bacterium]